MCKDYGIVLRYGNGPDSFDIFGAREANINSVNVSIISSLMVRERMDGSLVLPGYIYDR